MQFLLHAAFALTLVAFATGMVHPVHDARLDSMRGEFAALRLFADPALIMMVKYLLLLLFAVTAGLTLSGIVANIYRILARKPETAPETAIYYAVMVVAGPSVLFENATRSFRTRDCSALAYGLAVAITTYWCFALGLLILSLCLRV